MTVPELAPIINFEQAKVDERARLALRIGKGFATWFEAFEAEDIARKTGIGEVSIAAFRAFREELIDNTNKEKGIHQHQIEFKTHAKNRYSYRVYVIDGIILSFPHAYVNSQMEWLLKGAHQEMRIGTVEQKRNIVQYFQTETSFLRENFGIQLEFHAVSIDKENYEIWLDVPVNITVKKP